MAWLRLAIAAWALHSASALRTSAQQEPRDPQVQPELNRQKGLPSLVEHFNRSWSEKYAMEEHLWEPKPSSIRLVLGILTTLDLREYRDVIRETWLKQNGVCYWHDPTPACKVYVAFVYAARGLPHNAVDEVEVRRNMTEAQLEAAKHEEGMLELDTEENMNEGKTFVWMSTALKRFPWATHIGKMDMDTYPFMHKLLTRMSRNTTCAEHISPYQIIGRPGMSCPGKHPEKCSFKHPCPQDACLGQFHSDLDHVPLGVPWHFALGELYILSMPLVKLMRWTPEVGHEDMVLAKHLDKTAASKGGCVAFRRLDSHVHQLRPVTKSFANDA